MRDVVSPIEFMDFTLVAFDVDLHDSLKLEVIDLDEANLKYDLEIRPIFDFGKADNGIICKCLMTVIAEVFVNADEEEYHHVGAIRSRMAAISEYHDPSEESEEISQTVVAANTVSFIWGKIRDIVEQLSFSSCIGPISLPAIDPYAVLSGSDEDE